MELEQSGIDHEINFWRKFVETERFQQWYAPWPTPELNHHIRAVLNTLTAERDQLYVMDVGSGPVSILHGLNPKLKIETVDPLTTLYQQIFNFALYGIKPPLDYAAEAIPPEYHEMFDVVHISNALDHTKDPVLAFQSLLDCCRVGGYLIVQGFVNEALHENWQGFHQYNLSLDNTGCLIIADKHQAKVICPTGYNYETIWFKTEHVGMLDRHWFMLVLKKN